MKKLFANVSYSFNNFYNNLNSQGQIIFSIIVILILVLCILLLANYIINSLKAKKKISEIKDEKKEEIKEEIKTENKIEEKEELYIREETEIDDIAKRVEKALKEDSPITLTSFEEDQERTAIISIDELMLKAKELELINDKGINNVDYLDKYDLKEKEVSNAIENAMNKNVNENNKEVKAFRVSQIISPIYGVKKDDKNEF